MLDGGTLTNVSYVTIPADAAHPAAAKVLANVLLDPGLQAIKADPEVLGIPAVLDEERLPADLRSRSAAAGPSRYEPTDLGRPLQELPASDVGRLDARWKREVLR